MRYGLKDGLDVVIGASDSMSDYTALVAELRETGVGRLPDFMERLTDPRLKDFKAVPIIVSFKSEDEQAAFLKDREIKVLPPYSLISMQEQMKTVDEVKDTRTLRERFNLDQNDPWDKRTPEQKEAAAARAALGEEAKNKGALTGTESFPMPKPRTRADRADDIWIDSTKGHVDQDNQVVLDSATVFKGAWSWDSKEADGATTGTSAKAPSRNIEDLLKSAEMRRALEENPSEDDDDGGIELLPPLVEGQHSYHFVVDGPMGIAFLDQALDDLGWVVPSMFQGKPRALANHYANVVLGKGDGWFDLRDPILACRMVATLEAHKVAHTVTEREVGGSESAFIPMEGWADMVAPDGMIALFERVEVHGGHLNTVVPILNEAGLTKYVAARSDTPEGCWLAAVSRGHAESIGKALAVEPSLKVDEMYAVNREGERLLPKGTVTAPIDNRETNEPRPWNARAHELETMTQEEREANAKTLSPKEFIFTGQYDSPELGCTLYVTPRSYFKEHGEMWGGDLSLIRHLLPADLIVDGPGAYRTRSRHWDGLSMDMHARGFGESLLLQLWLNNQE